MSTFTIPNTSISVTLIPELTREELLSFPAFTQWLPRLQRNLSLQHTNTLHEFHSSPYLLKSITIQSLDRFGPKLGFLKFTTLVQNPKGETLAGSIFMRGAAVAMLVILQPDDLPEGSEKDRHVLLTVQPRIPAGGLRMVEIPAGMVDDGSFKGAAANEIKEELGLNIPEDQLTNLSDLAATFHPTQSSSTEESWPNGVFTSGGGSDEYIPIFLHQKRIPRSQLSSWTGKLTGLREKGEKITLKLIRLEDLWWEGARDAKALSALALFEGLKRCGKI